MIPCTSVSIPYGTIKRISLKTTTQINKKVSIPYGTIKSELSHSIVANLLKFQFLMVRLKGTALVTEDGSK